MTKAHRSERSPPIQNGISAAAASGLGAKVALIERELMGDDCLNFGRVPSKALLRAARAVADVGRMEG